MPQREISSRPQAFLSYSHIDDGDSFITGLRSSLESEMHIRLGHPFEIFQDIDDIRTGQDFADVIEEALADAAFFIPVLTPSYFTSEYCQSELRRFLKRESELGRKDLILPIYFVDYAALNDDALLRTPGYELQAAVKRHNWVDWRDLRKKGVSAPEFRHKSFAFADELKAAVERVAQGWQTQTVPDGDRYLREIKTVLDEVRACIQSVRFRRRYKAGVTLRVLTAARDEIQKLTGGAESYTQDLSLEENFIVRAGPIFSEASEVYAVSIDELSQFWVAEDQRSRAEDYTSHQPPNTVRLFVFSSMESAQRYRYVLAAHYARYGKTGGAVLICSRKQHQALWAGIDVNRVPDLLRKDFAVLIFREGNRNGATTPEVEYYEATLSNTKLVCRQLSDLQGYHSVLVEEFDRMRNSLAEGDIYDGIIKWREDFKYDDEEWTGALSRLFGSEVTGLPARSVFHIVLFSSEAPAGIIQYIEEQVRPRLEAISHEGLGSRLVEEFWFGSRNDLKLSVSDGIYNGQLRTSNFLTNSFPLALVLKLRSVTDLNAYYSHKLHAEVRKDLLSFCDPTIRSLYELVDSTEIGTDQKKVVFDAIEAEAAKYMLRSDFMLDSPTGKVLKVLPVQFDLPELSKLPQSARAAQAGKASPSA
jgi:hypothetical protein